MYARKSVLYFKALLAFLLLALLLLPLGGIRPMAAASAEGIGPVFVIPVNQEIERGLENIMERGFREAEQSKAGLIILEINTPGGRVDTAERIGELIKSSNIPTVAYINGNAASAGAYIALNADQIAMSPGSMIGAAALVTQFGTPVDDPKTIAAWKSMMASAAQAGGRNASIAEGMVDVNLEVSMSEIGKVKAKGQIISLTSEEALRTGYADRIVSSTEEVASWMGFANQDLFQIDQSPAERFAEFLTHPWVQVLLLFIGIAGIVTELIVPGFGVPGILGILSFGLYFFGNYVAGFAGYETWVLFIIGLVLLALELFVPSFGILGLLGSVSLVAGVVRAAYDTADALFALGIAFAAAAIVVTIVAVAFKDRGIWNKFILKESLTTDQGYSSVMSKDRLLGMQGTSLTPLRPAGTVLIEGERIDVVTEGGFIESNKPVSVIKVEGGRIVVKELL
ncbi:nodulation protein NfeD [Paenibacillus sp. P96]|uniref:Nodulation protein NfeD n=1 Tax=Paenibacillus zeirhizosphaerae TaxID=2987519 RepID=A0ABT9FQH9_9BACL|nr:nodulation protein NfeD [Paenibacillus sp. P96]MDP4096989.1 nodulation protein NfeD [Paenibacillus sp. P96]